MPRFRPLPNTIFTPLVVFILRHTHFLSPVSSVSHSRMIRSGWGGVWIWLIWFVSGTNVASVWNYDPESVKKKVPIMA